jgi:hypothetical protein
MEEKCKLKIEKKHGGEFNIEERLQIVHEYLSSNISKREIWEKYTGQYEEHGQILKWMRKFGLAEKRPIRKHIFEEKYVDMVQSDLEKKPEDVTFENLHLANRITELESKLKDAEMKAIAFSTMIDIAENEFKIPIRKKFNTKPLRK